MKKLLVAAVHQAVHLLEVHPQVQPVDQVQHQRHQAEEAEHQHHLEEEVAEHQRHLAEVVHQHRQAEAVLPPPQVEAALQLAEAPSVVAAQVPAVAEAELALAVAVLNQPNL